MLMLVATADAWFSCAVWTTVRRNANCSCRSARAVSQSDTIDWNPSDAAPDHSVANRRTWSVRVSRCCEASSREDEMAVRSRSSAAKSTTSVAMFPPWIRAVTHSGRFLPRPQPKRWGAPVGAPHPDLWRSDLMKLRADPGLVGATGAGPDLQRRAVRGADAGRVQALAGVGVHQLVGRRVRPGLRPGAVAGEQLHLGAVRRTGRRYVQALAQRLVGAAGVGPRLCGGEIGRASWRGRG